MDRLTEDQQALAADPKHIARALKIARVLATECPRLTEDFEGYALLGLVKAAQRFDPARGVKFATYADLKIRGAVLDGVREDSGHRKKENAKRLTCEFVCGSLSRKVQLDDEQVELSEIIPSQALPVGWEIESQDEVEHATRVVPYVYREAYRARYLNCEVETQKDVGELIGTTESRTSQIVANCNKTVRKKLTTEGEHNAA